MEESRRKKRIKNRQPTHLFFFFDKVLHAVTLINKRLTFSLSLHPTIYPILFPPVYAKFSHVKISYGFSIPLSSLSELSIANLKIILYIKESDSSKILGKCSIPLQDISVPEDLEQHMPFYFYNMVQFPLHANNVSATKAPTEICRIIGSVALGMDSHESIIAPTQLFHVEQIRYKKSKKASHVQKSEKLALTQVNYIAKNWQKFAEMNGWIPPSDEQFSDDHPNIEFNKNIDQYSNNEIILNSNHEIVLSQSPNRNQSEKKVEKKRNSKINLSSKDKKSITLNPKNNRILQNAINRNSKLIKSSNNYHNTHGVQNNEIKNENDERKPKFSGLMDRKLLNFNSPIPKNEINNRTASYLSDASSTLARGDSMDHLSFHSSKKPIYTLKKNARSSSIGPQRTTQYQLMTAFELDDTFPDKVLKNFQSDPPPRFSDMEEAVEETITSNYQELESQYEKSTQSLGFFEIDTVISSVSEEFLSSNTEARENKDRRSLIKEKEHNHVQEIKNEKNVSDHDEIQIQPNKNIQSNEETSHVDETQSLSEEIINHDSQNENMENNKFEDGNDLQSHGKFPTETTDETTSTLSNHPEIVIIENDDTIHEKSLENDNISDIRSNQSFQSNAFDSLEAMINAPTVPKQYQIDHYEIFDSQPSFIFQQNQIISVHIFRVKPDPRQRKVTLNFRPPPIIKSPSLEKILDEGMMELSLDLDMSYSDSAE
ncbi:hypothetical protein TRFO_00967 [Tritrichomonas foetus]|uniref:Uncharacterized protein n=1 Tax=Tritrichomonas foetus TaxID=1144522 RepID=A0A1J4L6U4_9EUKA|nr:hypothetical protein TRFO_00967 [Tritrichomonas foetus]|eukprot:OHT17669.1 hypothetical protein TRFO_00967 [Tritrichomonas foetus]